MVIAFALAAALWIDFARQALAADRVQWREWTDASGVAVSVVADQGKPGTDAEADPSRPKLLYFTADWCGPCRLMKSDVFSKSAVADAIHARFEPYRIDQSRPTSEQLRLAQAYGVQTVPTLLIVDAQGNPISRLDRVVEDDAFLEWLGTGYSRWEQARPSEPADGAILIRNQPLP